MEVSKKRKRDIDCPRITYDATTKVFDRLFKEESLEEMKIVVRKKLGLVSSLPVHLSQVRDGKLVVLEDDDDFDAFYVSVHSTPVARVKVYFGDNQPPPTSMASPDAVSTVGATQTLESSTVHHAAADHNTASKKRKVSFVEPISQPAGEKLDSSQSLPNSEAHPEVSATTNASPADAEEAGKAIEDRKKKEPTRNTKENKKGKPVGPTLEAQVQSAIAVVEASGSNSKRSTGKIVPENDAAKSKKRSRTSTADKSVQPVIEALNDTAARGTDGTEGHPRPSKKSKHKHKASEHRENAATNVTSDNQADTRTESPEELERRTPANGQADLSEVDFVTQSPQEMKKSRKKKKAVETVTADRESNVALSAPKSTQSGISNSAIVTQHAIEQDQQPPTSTSGLETNSKGKTKTSGPNQKFNTPTGPTLNEDETQLEQETKASVLAGGKTTTKKSSKTEALKIDVQASIRAATDAIFARIALPGNGGRQAPTRSSSLVCGTTSSPSAILMAPVTSSSSPDVQPKLSNNANTTAEPSKLVSKCPICDEAPSHFRSKCPIIKGGIRAMRRRITELRRDNEKERGEAIQELERTIDKKTRPKTPAAEKKSMQIKSMTDKPVIQPTLAADSSPATHPPNSKAVQSAKTPSQEIKSIPLPHPGESLSLGDVSSYTEQDLEALIRGPNVTLADVPSSDSSEDEEEEVLEDEEEMQHKSSRSQSRIRYPSSSEGEEEEEEEASPFVSSIIPLPIKSASELSSEDEDELSRSGDFRGDTTSFHEVNGLGSSVEVDKTGDTAVKDAYALDTAYLTAPELSENGRKAVIDDYVSDVDERQGLEEGQPEMVLDAARPPVTIATPQSTPQSDPIEASEKPESPPSPIFSIEGDTRPLQSTPKAEVGVRTRSQQSLVRKTASAPQTCVNGVYGINNKPKPTKKTGGLTRITDLPIPIKPAVRVVKPAGLQTRRQTARTEEAVEKADEQDPMGGSQAKQKNDKSASKTSLKKTKTAAKTSQTLAKVTVPSNGENLEARSTNVSQDVLESVGSAPNNEEHSLPPWDVLHDQGSFQSENTENKTLEMVDELHSSPDAPNFPPSAQKPAPPVVVNGTSEGPDPLFLHSESQQSFPYSQFTFPPGSEDEEDEVEASVVKVQTTTRSSSKFRSLTEIASQPTLFTPILRLAQTISAKEEVMNLYGRASKVPEDESEESDTESESEAEVKTQTSHIPMSRRAGVSVLKGGKIL